MKANRFFPSLKKYEETEIPDNSLLMSNDMDAICSCASCEKEMTFGIGFTSQLIHNNSGFGYSVCPECHEKEIQEEMISKYII